MFCSRCGSPNADDAVYCEKCGGAVANQARPFASGAAVGGSYPAQQSSYPPAGANPQGSFYPNAPYGADPRVRGSAVTPGTGRYAMDKSPFLALFLSFIMPGVGQLYNGDTKRGVPMVIAGLFSFVIVLLPVIGWVAWLGIHIWSMINAYNVASQKTPLG